MNGDTGPPGLKVRFLLYSKHRTVTSEVFNTQGDVFSQGLPGKTGASGLQGPVGKNVSLNLLDYFDYCVVVF